MKWETLRASANLNGLEVTYDSEMGVTIVAKDIPGACDTLQLDFTDLDMKQIEQITYATANWIQALKQSSKSH